MPYSEIVVLVKLSCNSYVNQNGDVDLNGIFNLKIYIIVKILFYTALDKPDGFIIFHFTKFKITSIKIKISN